MIHVVLNHFEITQLWKEIITVYNNSNKCQIPLDDPDFFNGRGYLLRKEKKESADQSVKKSTNRTSRIEAFNGIPIYEAIGESPNVKKHVEEFLADYITAHRGKSKSKGITYNSNEFYNIYLKLTKPKETLQLNGLYKDLFFKYIGYDNSDVFKSKYTRIPDVGNYTGVYFSQRHSVTKEFQFTITYDGQKAHCTLQGFHDRFPNHLFAGTGKRFGQFWNFRLYSDFLFIIVSIDAGDNNDISNFQKNNFKGSLLTINSEDKILFSEIFLIKKSQTRHDNDIDSAKKYLMMSRRGTLIEPFHKDNFENLDQLSLEWITDFDYFNKFIGKSFRIINLSVTGEEIIQSKIIFQPTFSCRIIYPRRGGRLTDHVGIISVKPGHADRVFINVMIKSLQYAYTVIDMKASTPYEYQGAYCMTPLNMETSIGGKFYLIPDSEIEDSEIKFYPPKEFVSEYEKKLKNTQDISKELKLNKIIKIGGELLIQSRD